MVQANLYNSCDVSSRLNGPSVDQYQHDEYMRKLVFQPKSRVPDLKPTSQIQLCGEELECGHSCGGCRGETKHLPCMEIECRPAESTTKHDLCAVCSSALAEEPAIELQCGHVFHAGCIREVLRHRWSTSRISFNFLKCPTCQQDIEGCSENLPEIRQELTAMKVLKRKLGKDALHELKNDKLDNNDTLRRPDSRFYQKPLEYALHMSEFYECTKCHCAYFGGYVNCQAEQQIEDQEFNLQEGQMEEEQLMCQNCRLKDMGIREEFFCQKHGLRHLQFKCDFCCSIAEFRCSANTYFCGDCHENPSRRGKYNCGGHREKCPYDIAHHPTKKGIPISHCIICTSAASVKNRITFEDQKAIRLSKVLKATDDHLKKIIKTKRDAQKYIDQAKMSQSRLSNTSSMSSIRSDLSSAASSSSSSGISVTPVGRLAF